MKSTCSERPETPPLRTITQLYDDYDEAASVVAALAAAGVSPERISLVAGDPSMPRGVAADGGETSVVELAANPPAGAARVTGAGLGGLAGAALGLLSGVGAVSLPALQPLIASGWLAMAAGGALAGATAGALLGPPLVTGLRHALARINLGRVRRGSTLVSVRTMQAEYDRIEAMMKVTYDAEETTLPTEGDEPTAASGGAAQA